MAADPTDPSTVKVMSEMVANIQKMSEMADKMAKAFEESARRAKDLSATVELTTKETEKILKANKDLTEEEDKQEKKGKERVTSRQTLAKVVMEQLIKEKELTALQQEALNISVGMLRSEAEISKIRAETARWDQESRMNAELRKKQLEDEASIFDKIRDKLKGKKSDEEEAARARERYEIDEKTGKAKLKEGASADGGKQLSNSLKDIAGALGSVKDLSADGIVGKISQLGPWGALIGLMISGRMEDMKWGAVGAGIKQQFDVIGGTSTEFGSKMAGTARALSVAAMASEKDLQSVAKAFAEVGVSGKEAAASIGVLSTSAGGIKIDSLMTATLALDKRFEMAAGSVAKLVGEFARISNIEGREALMSLGSIGMAAEKSGANVATFMSQVNEASSALKLFNVNAGDVGSLQLSQFTNLRGKGFTAANAQQNAAAGAQQATQGFSGMSDGMAAYLGEQVFKDKKGLDAWYATKSALGRGDDKDMKFESFIEETRKLVQSQTSNRSEQVMMLSKFGFGVQGSEAILDYKKGNGDMPKELKEAIRSGMMSEADKTSSIERAVNAIKDHILQAGSGMMQIVIGLIKTAVQFLMGIWSAATNPFNLDKAEGYGRIAMASFEDSMSGVKKVGKHLYEAGKAGIGAIGDIINAPGTTGWFYTPDQAQAAGADDWSSDKIRKTAPASMWDYFTGDSKGKGKKQPPGKPNSGKGKGGGKGSGKTAAITTGNMHISFNVTSLDGKTFAT